MKEFDAKSPGEVFTYACSFAKYLTNGVTIQSYSVEIEAYDKSAVANASTTGMISGTPQLNAEAIEIDGEAVGVGEALLQAIAEGAEGATYVVSFKPVLTDGQRPIEQVLLPISKYAPVT